MKRIALALFALFLSFGPIYGLAEAASPEQFYTVTVRPHKGLLYAMTHGQDVHCDPSQLTAVMKDNNLSWDDLLHLQPGQTIRLSSQCSMPAAPEIAVQSTAVVISETNRTGAIYNRAIQDLQNQVAALKAALANALSATAQSTEIAKLKERIKELQASNDLLTKRLASLTLLQKASFLGIGCLLASLFWGLYVFGVHPQPVVEVQKEYPDEKTYNNYGRIRRFLRISGPPYQCECGESNLQLHAIPRHCIRDHIEDRFEESETMVLEEQPQMA